MKKATLKDKKLVTDILESAFAPLTVDNSINFVVKQDYKRTQRMRLLMGYLFEKAFRFGEVYLYDNEKACILLLFPHKEKTALRTLIMELHLAFRCIGITRVYKVWQRQRISQRHYPKVKYIRPLIMGVKNENKGDGSAARLMLRLMRRYKDTALPVVLDAASTDNVRLYRRFGFKIYKEDRSLGFPVYFLRLD